MKLVKRTFFVLLIAVLTLLVVGKGKIGNSDNNNVSTDSPVLKSVKLIDSKVDPENGFILVAVDITQTRDADSITADILEIYSWGRSYYPPYLCGPKYEPPPCKMGRVGIIVVQEQPTLTNNGTATGYGALAVFWLNQDYIDDLLRSEPLPGTIKELIAYHSSVDQASQGTGGAYSEKTFDFKGFGE